MPETTREHRLDEGVRAKMSVLTFGTFVSTITFTFELPSFLDAKDVILCITAICLAVLELVSPEASRNTNTLHRLGWALLGYSLIVHVAFGFAAVPAYTLHQLSRFGLVLTIAVIVFRMQQLAACRSRIRELISLTAGFVAVLGLLQFAGLTSWLFPVFEGYDQRMYSVFGNQNLFAGFLAIALPIAVARSVRETRLPAFDLIIIGVIVLALCISGSRSAWMAAALGTAICIPRVLRDSRKRYFTGTVLLCAVGLSLAISPENTVSRLRSSFSSSDEGMHARAWIWAGTARMISDNPIVGVGVGNYPFWSPTFLASARSTADEAAPFHNNRHTLQAHSDPMQLIAENGLPGIVFLIATGIVLARMRGVEWGGVAAGLAFASVNPAAASSVHLLVVLLLVGNMAGRSDAAVTAKPAVRRPRLRACVSATGIILMAGVIGLANVHAGGLLTKARDASEQSRSQPLSKSSQMKAHEHVVISYTRACSAPWPSYAAHEERAMLYLMSGDADAALDDLDYASEGIDTGRIHYLRGVARDAGGDHEGAKAAYEQCLARWPTYSPAMRRLEELKL